MDLLKTRHMEIYRNIFPQNIVKFSQGFSKEGRKTQIKTNKYILNIEWAMKNWVYVSIYQGRFFFFFFFFFFFSSSSFFYAF